MKENIKRVLISEAELRAKVQELAGILQQRFADKNPVFVGVLKGVLIFFSDMIRQFDAQCQIDFMWISSYNGTTAGEMTVKKDVSTDLEGRHVIILEDIFDTGGSLDFTYRHLLTKHPASLTVCTLLDKPSRRKPGITLQPDYTGFVIDNVFVVGYGMDYNEQYRNLPYIGVLKPEVYQQ